MPPVRPLTRRNRRGSRAWNPAFLLLLLLHWTTGSRYGRGRGSHAAVRPEERAAGEAVRGPGAQRCHPGRRGVLGDLCLGLPPEREGTIAFVRCVAGAELEEADEIVVARRRARHADIYR